MQQHARLPARRADNRATHGRPTRFVGLPLREAAHRRHRHAVERRLNPWLLFRRRDSLRHGGPERLIDLLNEETGFVPFEIRRDDGTRTVLYNRAHIVLIALVENDASLDPGYTVATRKFVSILLSNGKRIVGAVRVYRPEGRDRLSDWARQPETFRYLETSDMALLLNTGHIVDVSEVPEP